MKLNKILALCALIGLSSAPLLPAAPQDGGVHVENVGPANDNFANRIVIPPVGGIVTGHNDTASLESGEPNPTGTSGSHSVWWTWKPATSGTVTISTRGSDFGSVVGVYTGSAVNGLSLVAASYYSEHNNKGAVTFNATAGVEYQIDVNGYSTDSGNIVLNVVKGGAYPTLPVNDNFANRITLSGIYASVAGYNAGGSKEIGEPDHNGNTGGRSIWWSWTAPVTGRVVIDTIGSSQDTVMAVYTGNSVAALTYVTSDDDAGGNNNSKVSFTAVGGTTYQIAVDGYGDDSGTVLLHLRLLQNDNFANSIQLIGTNVTSRATNINAVSEANEPAHAGLVNATNSLWWNWTAPANFHVVINTAGSSFNTVLAVYTGTTLNALSLVNEIHDDSTSTVEFNATAGQTYQISVCSVNGIGGPMVLNLFNPVQSNDSFAKRTQLTGSTITNIMAYNYRATREVGEPIPFSVNCSNSLWWTWTAPSAGLLTIDTSGSSIDTVLAVYTNATLATLGLVAQNDDYITLSGPSRVQFRTKAGTAYQIMVDGFYGVTGPEILNLNFAADSPNDNFASRIPIVGAAKVVYGTNTYATKELMEPNHAGNAGGHSVWWTWTAPATAPVTMSTFGSSFDTLLAVYTGTDVGGLSQVATNYNFANRHASQLTFTAVKGTAYQIAVDGIDGTNGTFVLTVSQTVPANDNFAKRIAFSGIAASTTANNANSTVEMLEPAVAGNPASSSLWWTWTAPNTGTVVLTTDGSPIDTIVSVYTGASVNSLNLVAENDDDNNRVYDRSYYTNGVNSTVTFNAVKGTAYQISVNGYKGQVGNFTLQLHFFLASPAITVQPANYVAVFNGPASFSVTATGSAPLSYQWYKYGSPIDNATNASLSFTHAGTFDEGDYSVTVTNVLGMANSGVATLNVRAEATKPTITLTSPAVGLHTTNATLLAQGTAADNVLVDHVSLDLNGNGFNSVVGRATWFTPITLVPGTNTITVKSFDTAGNESLPVVRTVVLLNKITFATNATYMGTITRNFTGDYIEAGKSYIATAVPKPGYAFAGWSGTYVTNTPVLNFIMQPGAYLEADFHTSPFPAVKGHYNGIFYSNPTVDNGSSGSLALDSTDTGSYSGKMIMKGVAYSFSGTLDISGYSRISVPRAGTNPVVLIVTNFFDGGGFSCYVTNANFISSGVMAYCPYNATTNRATNYMGKWTLVTEAPNDSMLPSGYGTATFTVDAAGNLTLIGKSADGSSFSQSTIISVNGGWQLYASCYGGKGCLLALNTFNSNIPSSFFQSSGAAWAKDATPGTKLYPNAFEFNVGVSGYPFVTPAAASTPLINLTVGKIFFSGGNLASFNNNATVGATTVITGPNNVTLTLNRTTGAVTGSFIHPVSHVATPLIGVVFQQGGGVGAVFGSFSGTNQTGKFFME